MQLAQQLKHEWDELLMKYTDSEDIINSLFNEIYQRYTSKHRHYHNLSHIESMLNSIKPFDKKIIDIDSLLFAIWYHDVIYNPVKNDNEEKSAEFANRSLKKIRINSNKIKKVIALILKSKSHISRTLGIRDDYDTKLFLDSDLHIFGAPKETYKLYMQQIREEHKKVPEFLFTKNRKKFLTTLSASKYIYHTDAFRENYEKKARNNIKYELETLA